MTIIFWNINQNNIYTELQILSDKIDPDIIFLAEANMSVAEILQSLNSSEVKYFFNRDPVCEKIKMFSKFHDKFVRPIKSNTRYMVRQINVPSYPIFNLMSLHYQSKVNWDLHDQSAHSSVLNLIIKDFEAKINSTNTIIMGDFNMNPFDFGMIQTTGLHSVMSKEIALKKNRIVDGEEYPFFYNPMWSFYGDYGKGKVNGTIYSSLSKPINYFWNIFDQILLRPEMIKYVDDDDIEIITELDPNTSLLRASNIINNSISDHLPIKLKVKNL